MEDSYQILRLKNQICFPIYLCSKEVIRQYSLYLDKVNLTYTQYIVMMFFWEKKESNVKELGETLLLDSSTLTPLLKKLEAKGFVERKRLAEDERNLHIKLTKKGEKLQKDVLEIPEQMAKKIGLTKEEEKTIQKLMCKMLVNIERNYGK